ncbi:MAG: hypothetical protein EZS28_016300, partial [Streblomastix strix]
AKKVFQQALDIDKKELVNSQHVIEDYDSLGNVFEKLGLLREAADAYNSSADLSGTVDSAKTVKRSESLQNSGRILVQLNQYWESSRKFLEASEILQKSQLTKGAALPILFSYGLARICFEIDGDKNVDSLQKLVNEPPIGTPSFRVLNEFEVLNTAIATMKDKSQLNEFKEALGLYLHNVNTQTNEQNSMLLKIRKFLERKDVSNADDGTL